MKAPISTRKHYVQFTEFNVPSLTVTEQVHAKGTPVQTTNLASEVIEGSVVKAVFVELWLTTDGSESGTFVVIFEKANQDASAPSLSEMTTLDSYTNKKNILFTSQGILAGEGSGNPTPVLRQWIKIPKGKQRIGLDDQLRINIASIGAAQLVGCSFATYKEYK